MRASMRAFLEEYDAYEEKMVRQAIMGALESDTEFVAEAQRSGLAIDVGAAQVEQNIDGYRGVMKRVQMERWRSAFSPSLREQMTSPDFAAGAYYEHDPGLAIGLWQAEDAHGDLLFWGVWIPMGLLVVLTYLVLGWRAAAVTVASATAKEQQRDDAQR